MKNGIVLAIAAFCITVLIMGYAYSEGPGNVRNTKHNFSSTGSQAIRAVSVDQVCVFCHTPHLALSDGPLWNHKMSTKTSYTFYWSSFLLSPTPSGNKPDGDSLLCLSCHDGDQPIGAVHVYAGQVDPTIAMTGSGIDASGRLNSGSSYFGADLSGHHPISIEYNTCLADDKLTQCGSVTWELKSPSTLGTYLKKTSNHYSGSGSCGATGVGVQCTSCHDAHSENAKFLRIGASRGYWNTSYDDTLCTTCHEACP